MTGPLLLDTGPLVALLNERDAWHEWAVDQWTRLKPPLLTCEAVLSEAIFLLRGAAKGPAAVLDMVKRGVIQVPFRATDHAPRIRQLLVKYERRPMSLADACLVCLAEIHPQASVFTLDRDFTIYRKASRGVIPVLMP